jgi:hypothetical protein
MDIAKLTKELTGKEAAMQNMWAIIDKGLVTEDAFGCPSDDQSTIREFTDRTDRRNNKVGWRTSSEFSYGLHFPYRSKTTGDDPADPQKVDNPAYLGPHMKGSFVIMADKNPSDTSEPAVGVGDDKFPSNHRNDGEAYLMFSGQVNWKKGIIDSDVNGDDIYVIDTFDNKDGATPADTDDQFITRHPLIIEDPNKGGPAEE